MLEIGSLMALQLLAAAVLSLPTAWHRETHGRTMGLRTFPLVSLGACAYVVAAGQFLGPDSPESMARIVQGLMTGIGFVGGGAILKNDDHVKGTATAASIWVTGALGAAVGLELWLLALLLCAFNFIIVWSGSQLKGAIDEIDEDDE